MPFGAGYTEYQPEIIFVDPFGAKTVLQDVLLLELFRITHTGECREIIISVIIVVLE